MFSILLNNFDCLKKKKRFHSILKHEAHHVGIDENGSTDQPKYLIVAAKTAAGIMMSIVWRGWTIWLINIILCVYFFTQTFKIADYNRIKAAISSPMFVPPDGTLRKKNARQNESYEDRLVFYIFESSMVIFSILTKGIFDCHSNFR